MWVQDKFKRLQAAVHNLAESVSPTSTDAAAVWNQASLPPPLPAAEDPESVDPRDTTPSAVASEAVALLHGSATYDNSFNDISSAADNNIDDNHSLRL